MTANHGANVHPASTGESQAFCISPGCTWSMRVVRDGAAFTQRMAEAHVRETGHLVQVYALVAQVTSDACDATVADAMARLPWAQKAVAS